MKFIATIVKMSAAVILVVAAIGSLMSSSAQAMDLSGIEQSKNIEFQFLPDRDWLAQNCRYCVYSIQRETIWMEMWKRYHGQRIYRYKTLKIAGAPAVFNELTQSSAAVSIYVPTPSISKFIRAMPSLACAYLLPRYPKTLDMQWTLYEGPQTYSRLQIKCSVK